jgi:hypothetical protein
MSSGNGQFMNAVVECLRGVEWSRKGVCELGLHVLDIVCVCIEFHLCKFLQSGCPTRYQT